MEKFSDEIQIIKQNLLYQKDKEIRIRGRFLLDVMSAKSVTAGCKREGKGTRYFYYWYNRWKKSNYSIESLKSLSRAPKVSPRKTSDKIIELAVYIRGDKGMGGGKVAYILRRDYGIKVGASSICRQFRNNGISKVYRIINKNGHKKRYACKNPLQRVQTDSSWLGIENEFENRVYIFPVIDDCSRAVSVFVTDSKSGQDAVAALDKFQNEWGKPKLIQSDNGVEFTDKYNSRLNPLRQKEPKYSPFEQECKSRKIRHYLIRPRTPQLNGKVERFNQTIKSEMDMAALSGKSMAYIIKEIEKYVFWYNRNRPHGALKYLTPYERFYQIRMAKLA